MIAHVPILALGDRVFSEKETPFIAVRDGIPSDPRTVILAIEGADVLVHADELTRAINLVRSG